MSKRRSAPKVDLVTVVATKVWAELELSGARTEEIAIIAAALRPLVETLETARFYLPGGSRYCHGYGKQVSSGYVADAAGVDDALTHYQERSGPTPAQELRDQS